MPHPRHSQIPTALRFTLSYTQQGEKVTLGTSSARLPARPPKQRGGSQVIPYTSTKGASILGVLGDFNLLDLLTQGSTVAGAVLADDADFLGALGLTVVGRSGWMDGLGVGG